MKHFPYLLISAKAGRGYGLDEISPELSDEQIKVISKNWAPKGQNWKQYLGLKFIRTIVIPLDSIGWIETKITDEMDEFNRTGLLSSKVYVVPQGEIGNFVQLYFKSLSPSVRSVSNKYMPGKLGLYWRTFWKSQTVISAPISLLANRSDWFLVEAIVLRVFLALPNFMQNSATFTTLSLSPDSTETIIGIPNEMLRSKAHVNVGK